MGYLIFKNKFIIAFSLFLAASLTGCSNPLTSVLNPPSTPSTNTSYRPATSVLPSALYHVENTSLNTNSHTVTLLVHRLLPRLKGKALIHRHASEQTIDLSSREGIINFGTATYADQTVSRIRVVEPTLGHTSLTATINKTPIKPSTHPPTFVAHTHTLLDMPVSYPLSSPPSSSISLPPPGVRMDLTIKSIAALTAQPSAKLAAILSIGQSKLGTPYIWGHNEDRGQYGFDCSNFTEYVYHHALGYLFTTSSKGQYQSVGVPVSISDMQPGDLIAFNYGSHVGIYIGNGQMLQEGGGLKKVGYLPLHQGSYWYNHISAVKRMY